MTPALVAAAIAAPLLRPEPWSAVALQQASSPDGALTGATAATGGRHTARASNGSRWPTGRPHARTLWACGRDCPGLSSLRAEDGRVPPRRQSIWSGPCMQHEPGCQCGSEPSAEPAARDVDDIWQPAMAIAGSVRRAQQPQLSEAVLMPEVGLRLTLSALCADPSWSGRRATSSRT